MNKEKLKELVDSGLSQRKIAKKLNCSQANVKYWLKRHGLKTQLTHQQFRCKHCEVSEPRLFKKGRGRVCRECEKIVNVIRFRDIKRTFVDYKGGRCEICGYSKCLGSLSFHHKNPEEKDSNWSVVKNWPLKRAKMELDKCSLLCNNCHGEVHYTLAKSRFTTQTETEKEL